jgi:hypothetical protein
MRVGMSSLETFTLNASFSRRLALATSGFLPRRKLVEDIASSNTRRGVQ